MNKLMVAKLNSLLHRPMGRKTFLKTLLLGVIVVTGLSGIVRIFGTGKDRGSGLAYGAAPYGGNIKQL